MRRAFPWRFFFVGHLPDGKLIERLLVSGAVVSDGKGLDSGSLESGSGNAEPGSGVESRASGDRSESRSKDHCDVGV